MRVFKNSWLGIGLLLLFGIAGCKSSSVQKQVASASALQNTANANIPTNLKWSERMALSTLKRNEWLVKQSANAGWGYTQGLLLFALEKTYQETGNNMYMESVKMYADEMIDANGKIKGYKIGDYNLDNINAGKILFEVYASTKDEKYRKAIETLRVQLKDQPRVSQGGYWHKQKYTSQMWLDGAYMASPFLAEYAKTFNDPKAFDEVALQLTLMNDHLRDAKTGLLYHGWDESRSMIWANKLTGASPNFWGRAIGWYVMAIVDALDHFSKDHPKRNELIQILKSVTASLVKFQDAGTGLWYQVVDQGNRKGNYLEASASAMFVYAIAKGVKNGYLPKKYMSAATKGYNGLINNLVKVKANGEVDLLQICEVAGLSADRDGSYEYYINEAIRINDPKGTGPFILASIELNK